MNYKDRIDVLWRMTDEEMVSFFFNKESSDSLEGVFIDGIKMLGFFHEYIGTGDFDGSQPHFCADPYEVADALEAEGVSTENIERGIKRGINNSIQKCVNLKMPNMDYSIENFFEKQALAVSQAGTSEYHWNYEVLPYYADDIAKLIIMADRISPMARKKVEELQRQIAIAAKIREITKKTAVSQIPSILSTAGYDECDVSVKQNTIYVRVGLSNKRVAEFFIKYDEYQDSIQKLITTLNSLREAERLFGDTLIIKGIRKKKSSIQ